MRLSFSIQTDVLKAKAGHILNTFKIYPRRDVLFFEDILAQYIRECEKAGFGAEMSRIGHDWSAMVLFALLPSSMRKLDHRILTLLAKNIWSSIGLVDDLQIIHKKNSVKIKTKNEIISRTIGRNSFMAGFYSGILNFFLGYTVALEDSFFTDGTAVYLFAVTGVLHDRPRSCKESYLALNVRRESGGSDLKVALNSSTFRLVGNRLYYKNKLMVPLENTLFHLISGRGINLDVVSTVSFDFFKGLLAEDSGRSGRLVFLRTLLEVMGWGKVKIVDEKGGIRLNITNPPHGLQPGRDRWEFLCGFVGGYIRTFDKKLSLEGAVEKQNFILLAYIKK